MLDGSQVYPEGIQDVDLEVISQVDKFGNFPALVLLGSSTPGKQAVTDVRVRLRCVRTEAARLAARRAAQRQPRAVSRHQAQHIGRLRAQRQADADLLRALATR